MRRTTTVIILRSTEPMGSEIQELKLVSCKSMYNLAVQISRFSRHGYPPASTKNKMYATRL